MVCLMDQDWVMCSTPETEIFIQNSWPEKGGENHKQVLGNEEWILIKKQIEKNLPMSSKTSSEQCFSAQEISSVNWIYLFISV